MTEVWSRSVSPVAGWLVSLGCVTFGLLLSSCTTSTGTTGSTGQGYRSNHPAVKARDARIAQEPPATYYYGRRYFVDGTRFWGYVRKAGQPWSESRLVIMDESIRHQPDRVPEEGEGLNHGYDHNWEYRIWGSFTNQEIYDPNSNFILPEFRLSKYELVSKNPGFLFHPNETYNPRKLPPKHPPLPN